MPRRIVALLGICLLILPMAGCRERTREAAEVVATLEGEVNNLEEQLIALRTENSRLRAELLGETWTGMIQLDLVGALGSATPYMRICPVDQTLIGLRGRAGAYIDGIVPVCGPRESPEAPRGVDDQR